MGLGKCQSNDFDAQIADATITLVQHILLTCKFRYENYESKAGMFVLIKEEATLQRLNQRLWGLFLQIVHAVADIFEDIDREQLFEKIMHNEQVYEKIARLFDKEEANRTAA